MVYITYSTGAISSFRSAKSGDLGLEAVGANPEIIARFWRFVETGAGDQCWLWTGNVVGKAGHGQFAVRHNVNRYAHRIAWFLAHGSIPDGLKVCHHCDVPRCVNTAHLFIGTQADNLADMRAKGRQRPGGKRPLQAPASAPKQPQGAANVSDRGGQFGAGA